MQSIQNIIVARGIESLFHFTKVANLDSILRHGLLPPESCKQLALNTHANDMERHDNQDAICLTVSYPNYRVFFPFRTKEPIEPWVVIELFIDILHKKRCAFNTTNAADASQSRLSFADRSTPKAFAAMFDDYGNKKRESLGIQDKYPTNPQAEVLCLDPIPTDFIKGLHFDNHASYTNYRNRYANKPKAQERIHYSNTYFAPRNDYAHWN